MLFAASMTKILTAETQGTQRRIIQKSINDMCVFISGVAFPGVLCVSAVN
jgi:hypothetical protein